ncbi:MAG: dinitrogenase iron-molybdenum cofactor biosynthesis protein [Methylococcaceae bacterium]|nr:dinitrogenase iron-molybdenum cofactor biosynthesis protein [Methylococcaceae bacterium]
MAGQNALSRELALRIGLAARALPDTDAKSLFQVLIDCVSLPITEKKLIGITPQSFKEALGGYLSAMDESSVQAALHILKQPVETPGTIKQSLQDYTEGDMPRSVRIACASNDGINVDGHFGSCSHFLIYQVSADEARLIDMRDTVTPAGLDVEDKNLYRARLIQDCQVIYMASVGGPAAAKIVKLGIHPIKLTSIDPIAEVITQLQSVIDCAPPPWLAKVMGIEASNRFRFEWEAQG